MVTYIHQISGNVFSPGLGHSSNFSTFNVQISFNKETISLRIAFQIEGVYVCTWQNRTAESKHLLLMDNEFKETYMQVCQTFESSCQHDSPGCRSFGWNSCRPPSPDGGIGCRSRSFGYSRWHAPLSRSSPTHLTDSLNHTAVRQPPHFCLLADGLLGSVLVFCLLPVLPPLLSCTNIILQVCYSP